MPPSGIQHTTSLPRGTSRGDVTSILLKEQLPKSLSYLASISAHIIPLTAAFLPSSGEWQAAAMRRSYCLRAESCLAACRNQCLRAQTTGHFRVQCRERSVECCIQARTRTRTPLPYRFLPPQKKIDCGNGQWRTAEATRGSPLSTYGKCSQWVLRSLPHGDVARRGL
jgi:hypothetical protein